MGLQNVNEIYYIFERCLINFPVAVFFFLAGYFFNPDRVFEKQYYIDRLRKLLIPYLIWSFIYIVIDVLSGKQVSIASIIYKLCIGKASGQMYYIVVLTQLLLITPIVFRLKNKRVFHVIFSLITPAHLVLQYISIILTDGFTPIYYRLFLGWFGFYYWGIMQREHSKVRSLESKRNSLRMPFVILVVAVCLEIGETYLLMSKLPLSLSVTQMKLSSFLYVAVLIWILINISSRNYHHSDSQLLIYLGDHSYGLFYIHMIAVSCVESLVSMLDTQFWIMQVIEFALAIVISLLLYFVVRKMLGEAKGRLLLGL